MNQKKRTHAGINGTVVFSATFECKLKLMVMDLQKDRYEKFYKVDIPPIREQNLSLADK